MATHELKTWPSYFEAIKNHTKTFEFRLNDRGFKVGDMLVLSEYNPASKTYTKNRIFRVISYVYETPYWERSPHREEECNMTILGLARVVPGCEKKTT